MDGVDALYAIRKASTFSLSKYCMCIVTGFGLGLVLAIEFVFVFVFGTDRYRPVQFGFHSTCNKRINVFVGKSKT